MATGGIRPLGTAVRMPFRSSLTGYPLIPLGLICAAVLAPFFLHRGVLVASVPFYKAFALVCHQRPERCFWIFGAPVAVCARCLGIYFGAAIGLLVRTSRRVALQLLIVAACLNLVDAVAEASGVHGNWLDLRFALGLALGACATMLIASGGQHHLYSVPHRLDNTN